MSYNLRHRTVPSNPEFATAETNNRYSEDVVVEEIREEEVAYIQRNDNTSEIVDTQSSGHRRENASENVSVPADLLRQLLDVVQTAQQQSQQRQQHESAAAPVISGTSIPGTSVTPVAQTSVSMTVRQPRILHEKFDKAQVESFLVDLELFERLCGSSARMQRASFIAPRILDQIKDTVTYTPLLRERLQQATAFLPLEMPFADFARVVRQTLFPLELGRPLNLHNWDLAINVKSTEGMSKYRSMISKKFTEGGHHSVSDYDDFTAENIRIAELRGFVQRNLVQAIQNSDVHNSYVWKKIQEIDNLCTWRQIDAVVYAIHGTCIDITQQARVNGLMDTTVKPVKLTSTISLCHGCGKTGHKRAECKLINHPDINKLNMPFKNSDIGKIYVNLGKNSISYGWQLDNKKESIYSHTRFQK
jgi:hypothetical protein